MATKRISELQLRSDFDATCNVPVDDASQSWRTTGQQLRNFIAPLTTIGDLLFATTAGAAQRLAIGSVQQSLKPVAGVPAWAFQNAVQRTATTTDAISATTDHIILLDATGGAFTATLPTAASVAGKTYILKKIGTDLNIVTIATTSSQTIDGVVGTALHTPNETLEVFSNGSNWIVLSRKTAFALSAQAWADSWANATASVELFRQGNRIFISGLASVTGAGATNYDVTIPAAYTAAASYTFGTAEYLNVGPASLYDLSVTTAVLGTSVLSSTTNLRVFSVSTGLATINATAPFTWASGDKIKFEASWIVSGWNA